MTDCLSKCMTYEDCTGGVQSRDGQEHGGWRGCCFGFVPKSFGWSCRRSLCGSMRVAAVFVRDNSMAECMRVLADRGTVLVRMWGGRMLMLAGQVGQSGVV
jgi:hypothetical protein